MPHSMSSSSLDSAAEQRDPFRVTKQRVRHAAGISLGQRGQRDPYGVTELRVRHAVGISLGSAVEQRNHSRITKRASITWNRPSGRRKWQDITVIFVLLRLDFLLLTL